MKKIKLPFIIIILIVLFISIFFLYKPNITGNTIKESTIEKTGENKVILVEFYGKGCPHCASLNSFLNKLKEKYPSLYVEEYEIYFSQKNRELFSKLAETFGTKIQGVPTVFIDDKVIVGFSKGIGESLEKEIQRCLKEKCNNPLEKIEVEELTEIIGEKSPLEDPRKTKFKQKITIPAVLGAAAVDAINPCAFAVLIILISTILISGVRKRALFAGLAFSLSIYISYFLMGLGLYSAIQTSGLTHIFYFVVAVLAIIIGLFNLKDYLWYGKWFIMEVPLCWRPLLKTLLKGVTSIPGAFGIGFLVSLFLLPCTSGPYIVILGLLSKAATRAYAIILLLIYNFIFILPMLIITFGIYFGITTPEKMERWRTRSLKKLHLIAGIIILALGIGMLIALKFNWI